MIDDLPRYKDLDAEQRQRLLDAGILNGCGPQDWRKIKFNWLFTANCHEHDYNYAVGGTEADRRWADWGFYQAMVRDTRRLVWWKRWYARAEAWIRYQAVRWFGSRYWSYDGPEEKLLESL